MCGTGRPYRPTPCVAQGAALAKPTSQILTINLDNDFDNSKVDEIVMRTGYRSPHPLILTLSPTPSHPQP